MRADGPAYRAGLRAGDVVVSANGHLLRDVIDWRWESDAASVRIEFKRGKSHMAPKESAVMTREPNERWGLEFDRQVFDGIRTCTNRCAFCFIDQLPPGLRDSLYVRDDDYRLSFLHGNFITLTNVDEGEMTRIIDQRLSPLYVSLHAVDSDVRRKLLCPREDSALQHLDSLLGHGIELHVQIVLVPGVNDGPVLERTLRWLRDRPGVSSVGVVPLGYTRHQNRFASSYGEPQEAAAVLDLLEVWRRNSFRMSGERWAHGADEFYLTAGRELPTTEEYDGFPQYENGIGLVRTFTDEFIAGLRNPASSMSGSRDAVVVTGMLFASVLNQLIEQSSMDGLVGVLPVENVFFGGNVTVTGLLTGADLLDALREGSPSNRYLVPDAMFNEDGLTLDGMTAAHISQAAGRRVEVLPATATGLLFGIL